MNYNIKEIRTFQLAALALMKRFPACRVETVSSPYYDLLVIFDNLNLIVGIEVKNTGFIRTQHFENYINSLKSINIDDPKNRIPILIASVNEEEETVKIGFLLSWQYGQIRIYTKPSMVLLNDKNADKILDLIKSMGNSILYLSNQGMKVIKKINIEFPIEKNHLLQGTLIYLRDFTNQYHVIKKEIITEREKFEKLLQREPQIEYPEDELDRIIFEMSQRYFVNCQKKTDLLLLSTELKKLHFLSSFYRKSIEFMILPDIELINLPRNEFKNIIKGIHFNIDIFFRDRRGNLFFDGLYFEELRSLEGWDETYHYLIRALHTLSSPRDLFIE